MADLENDLDLETIDQDIENKNKVEKRIKDLSEKVRLTSEERDERETLLTKERAEKEALQKENSFLSSFGDALAKYPKASSHRDEIKDKVLKGYSVEDATISTLASKGEFSPRPVEVVNPAGGAAAVNQPVTGGQKNPSEMTRDEKRALLLEAQNRGELSVY